MSERHAVGDEFAGHPNLAVQSDTLAESLTDRLKEVTEALVALQRQHLRMSNTQYLLARFALQEQITIERQKAGEDIETVGIRIEGKTFEIGGRCRNPDFMEAAKLPADVRGQVAKVCNR
ncbi:hypothetical protein N7E02_10750 [Aliirhizobium terrae]|uniref:hypothetical protein n=1 Tax=Terrirhizobium terrae TaxID=2926709 RepID=UPI00257496CC|nr:hypothetical protein [Rhizobium sp. CC-CFT758]WJH40986.1 hypothetical protein N7E02_10750 [Rhizobium sp. CC-CFT758]